MGRKILLAFVLTFAGLVLYAHQTATKPEAEVPVIKNGLHPKVVKGQPSQLSLKTEFIIDMEDPKLAEVGLTDPSSLDIDSQGRIYIATQTTGKDFIFKFDETGKFLASFCRSGQGPGEIQFPTSFFINSRDELVIGDIQSRKLVIMDTNGRLIREKKDFGGTGLSPVDKGFLCEFHGYSREKRQRYSSWCLLDEDLKKTHELVEWVLPTVPGRDKFPGVSPGYLVACGSGRIFIGEPLDRGYEILILDAAGNIKLKAQKEFVPIRVEKSFVDKVRSGYPNDPAFQASLYFPEYFPPFQGGFADDEGRLFVMTYEKGPSSNEYINDVFSKEGILIARIGLENYGSIGNAEVKLDGPLFAMAKKGRLYLMREKDDGFKEVVVSRMIWK